MNAGIRGVWAGSMELLEPVDGGGRWRRTGQIIIAPILSDDAIADVIVVYLRDIHGPRAGIREHRRHDVALPRGPGASEGNDETHQRFGVPSQGEERCNMGGGGEGLQALERSGIDCDGWWLLRCIVIV